MSPIVRLRMVKRFEDLVLVEVDWFDIMLIVIGMVKRVMCLVLSVVLDVVMSIIVMAHIWLEVDRSCLVMIDRLMVHLCSGSMFILIEDWHLVMLLLCMMHVLSYSLVMSHDICLVIRMQSRFVNIMLMSKDRCLMISLMVSLSVNTLGARDESLMSRQFWHLMLNMLNTVVLGRRMVQDRCLMDIMLWGLDDDLTILGFLGSLRVQVQLFMVDFLFFVQLGLDIMLGCLMSDKFMGIVSYRSRGVGRNIATDVILHLLVMRTVIHVIVCMEKAVHSGSLVMHHVMMFFLHGLHLDHEIAPTCIYIRWVEDTAILLETSTGLMPSTAIKSVKVVSPVELKLVLVLIESEHFDIVIKNVPWHVYWVESLAPRVESRRPEVHSERLGLAKIFYGFMAISRQVAHLFTIDGEGDVFRGPLHLICVPVVMWVESLRVIMVFLLLMAIAINQVCRQWIVFHRRHNFDVKLVPSSRVEARTVPVGEERRDCALLVWSLHSCDKFTVGELLVGGKRSTFKVCGSDADDRDQRQCKLHLRHYSSVMLIIIII